MKRCVSCGKEIVEAAVNCLFCGSKQSGAEAPTKKTVIGFGTAGLFPGASPPAAPSLAPIPTARPITPAPITPPPDRRPVAAGTPHPIPRRPTTDRPRHESHPFEPWAKALRVVLIAAGAVLVVGTAAPHGLDPLAFVWEAVADSIQLATVMPLVVGVGGLILMLVGLAPVVPVARATVALVVGLAPGLALQAGHGLAWRTLAGGLGLIAAAAGLLVRGGYPTQRLGSLVATAGALAVLATYLVPLS